MTQLAGKSVLVVGGSSGIGQATAAAVKSAGALVTIASRSAEKLVSASEALGGVETISLDVSDELSVAQTLGRAGTFDHVAVTSGLVPAAPVRGQTTAKAMSGFASKFWGAYHIAAYANIAQNGSLTLISGVFADRPQKGLVAASCVNAAINALGRALCLELAPIRVNVVSPGLIDTPLWGRMAPEAREAFYRKAAESLPNHYIGKPDDVAALFLACMTNPLLSGSVLIGDSGRVLV